MEIETKEQEVVQIEQKSALHKVTSLSKYLAMVLFIILPFLGGYMGYTIAPEKIVEVEKEVIMETVSEESVSAEVVSDVPSASATVPRYCVRVNSRKEASLYTHIRSQIIPKYPDYDLERLVGDGYECLSSDSSYIALMPFFNEVDIANQFWGHFIVRYDNDAVIQHISKPFNTATGAIFTSEMLPQDNDAVTFIINATDPCYSAYHLYAYSIKTGELSEKKYGGEDEQCWDRMRESGRPY